MPEDAVQGGARTVAQIEATIRKRARPVLNREERQAIALEKAVDQAELVAARAAAAAQEAGKRASASQAEAVKLRQELERHRSADAKQRAEAEAKAQKPGEPA